MSLKYNQVHFKLYFVFVIENRNCYRKSFAGIEKM